MTTNIIHISDAINSRLDPHQFNPERMLMLKRIYASKKWGKLKDVVNNVKKITQTLSDKDIYIGLENITSNTGEYIPTTEKQSISSAAVFQRGNILFPKLRPYLNKVHLAEFAGKCSTEFHVFETKGINPNFLTILLRSNIILAQTKHLITGNTLPRLQTTDIENIVLPIISNEEQERIVNIYKSALNDKVKKYEEAQSLLENIDPFLLEVLDIASNHQHNKKSIFSTTVSNIIGQRLDVSSYKEHFEMLSNKFPNRKLSSLVEIDPAIRFAGFNDDTTISFIPMECIDEKYGEFSEQREIAISQIKGYTKFEEGDLLWAKITPCMQNGKSAIARNLKNGIGCGSTEYYVIRPKTEELLIDYVYLILRHSEVLKAAQGSFGGSAGQQRVSSQYMKSIVIPFPSKDIQQSIVDVVKERKQRAKQLQMEGTVMLEKAKQEIEKLILDL